MKNERYYYSIMNKAEQEAYKCIYQGLQNRSYQIHITSLNDIGSLQVIYIKLLFDNPLFYYVNQRVIKASGVPFDYYLMPEYLYSQREIEQLNRQVKGIVAYICKKAKSFQSEFRMEKYIHDSIVKSVAYDYDALMKDNCVDAHSIIGALLKKKAVCEGIAKAFKLLCNELGIKCIVVVGKASEDGNFLEEDDIYHAWNIVKIEGESYYVDVTWDNIYEENFMYVSYDYFNLTTEEICKDHIPEEKLPICRATKFNYFYFTNSFVGTYEELKQLINDRIKKASIVFKAKKGSIYDKDFELLKEDILRAIKEVLWKYSNARAFRLMFNKNLKIGKIYFLEENKVSLIKNIYK